MNDNKITVETRINKPMDEVWEKWTKTEHITKWNQASDDWHCPTAENDLRPGGTFTYRMAARDGSSGFDFGGTYDEVVLGERITYTMGDKRQVEVIFKEEDGKVLLTEHFDAEEIMPREVQRSGWQAILNNFKAYVEES